MKRLQRECPPRRTGIVHLGPGAFFRSFIGTYTEDAADADDWGITAVSLRSPVAKEILKPQGGAYTSVTLGPDGMQHRVINAISEVLVAPEDPAGVVSAMADPSVRIVSLTVTEKGYCHAPATGRLMLEHPDIARDLENPHAPKSTVGLIVAALARRKTAFTVLSCDNLPSNGVVTRGVVLEYAQTLDTGLAAWIAANVPFPSTMVDRITPAPTEADVERLAEAAGYYDPACVVHEPFRQWVIEDRFANGRPSWDATFVNDVARHEAMKLRCLNGTHSALAYLGYLAGFQTIDEAVADPDFAGLCKRLWAEIMPTVATPEGEDVDAYCAALLKRYQNTGVRHRLWQIAMDGSQKLPQRILGTVRDHLTHGTVPEGLCLVAAAWMRYVGGVDERGQPIDVRDPMAATFRGKDATALLDTRDVFGDLSDHADFRACVLRQYDALARDGARAVVARLVRA